MIDFLVLEINKLPGLLAMMIFVIVGVVIFYNNLKKYLIRKKNCKVTVEGEIVKHEEIKPNCYSSVYRYIYNGNEYTTVSSAYSMEKEELGTRVKLLINPENPNEINDGKDSSFVVLMFMGIMFIVIPLPLAMILILT